MRIGALRAQARAEVVMTLRRGETLLVTIGIPVMLLVFFSLVHVLPTGTPRHPIDFLAPGVLSLAAMSTAMVSLGIATAFERSYGVLKRLGTTPLGRPALLAAKIAGVLAVEVLQVAVLAATAVALGWRPHVGALEAIPAYLLGTIAFAGIGLAMAGALRAEVTLAAANGLYVVLLLVGGILFPVGKLGPLADAARLLPATQLSAAMRTTLQPHAGAVSPGAWIVLSAWALAMPLLAAATFKWE
ncbi:MAG TPA: ABC transporter permease [Acidimicrobiales bacterium]|nr:ABC transporter permease [Acidimicrobiales bacterium]